MLNAKSLLDNLMGGLDQVAGGKGAKGLADTAKAAWSNQSTLGKGAIAGGLLGVLLTQGGRRLLGTGAKIGGAALIGGLAWKAYQDWQAGKDQGAADTTGGEDDFLPADPAEADDLATRLLQAMIAAAKADGHIIPEERQRIDSHLADLGLGDEAASLIAAELDAPLDAERVAGLARNDREAAEIYAASLLVIDQDSAVEVAYLAQLAAALGLAPDLVARLHARAESLAAAPDQP